ncbi:uncharacterized protein LOC104666972 [Rhinopithecus roxellana]|uniref:uncharacterized protein LOC104666972 n=1 Tax=Rhinopithecus roxellana TaxID=61622 RepID=UPI0005336D73|nr:uncharacterized protein LOC104666972 [Rhinopithecus roxellana]XP_017723430.1 PREDICTED: translation initiation factor IF-2-like [Rhinopithecus bieti]
MCLGRFGRPPPSATPATRPGADRQRRGRDPKAPSEKAAGSPATRQSDPHPQQPGGASTRTTFVSKGALAPGRRPVGNTCRGGRRRGPRVHTPARGAGFGPAGTLDPATPAHRARARRATAVPDGGRGHGRRRHLPGSASSFAGGSSRASDPRHHFPPPPSPRRRLPTAHSAPLS